MSKKILALFLKLYSCFITKLFKQKYLVFYSKHGYVDNPKYLMKHCVKNGLQCVWIQIGIKGEKELFELKGQSDFSLSKKKNFLLNQYYIARAKYVFVSHSFYDIGSFLHKSCKVVNLWHGVALKKMGYDSDVDKSMFLNGSKINPYLTNDYLIVSNEESRCHMISCMQLPSERVVNLGQPRNDILLKKISYASKSNGELTFLYAPTFRSDEVLAVSIYKSVVESFYESAPSRAKLVLRLHPNEAHIATSLELSNRVRLSTTEDVQEELINSHVLISDYSSIIFDFALTRKPILIFSPDKEEYFKERSGFYFNFEGIFNGIPQFSNAKEINWAVCKDENNHSKLLALNGSGNSSERIIDFFNLI